MSGQLGELGKREAECQHPAVGVARGAAPAGIEDFRWHDLRHTWASWHARNGTPMNVLQELGGWRDAEIVQRYAHLGMEQLERYAQRHAEQARLLELTAGCDSATLETAPEGRLTHCVEWSG